MKFGIIAEGASDFAVIRNILIGLELIEDNSDIRPIRPELDIDATSRAEKQMEEAKFSSWSLVRQECVSNQKLIDFLINEQEIIDEERVLIIQIDTAECEMENYEVDRPNKKSEDYSDELRKRVIEKITEWLDNEDIIKCSIYAISIEETEAWIHALYENINTSKFNKPKESFLKKFLPKYRGSNKKFKKKEDTIRNHSTLVRYDFYSSNFRKIQKKKIKSCLNNNRSLELFVDSLLSLKQKS